MRRRAHIHIDGTVQGVGFRPFVYRVAHDLELAGWVKNTSRGVDIEFEGPSVAVDRGIERLQLDPPAHATVSRVDVRELETCGSSRFEILTSDDRGGSTSVLPDLATCADCRREIFDKSDRRHRYPFTNCTNCGPRFSIIEAIPYDRSETTMRGFRMCARCQSEYEDPLDRRFHAQPNACPDCGPRLTLRDAAGEVVCERDDALRAAEAHICQGDVVAIKGLGGFHLVVDARNEAAVSRLRRRKARPDKPFALMFPSLEAVEEVCRVSATEQELLTGASAPIVLLDRRLEPSAARLYAAPQNPRLGIMLPYTPLHLLLLANLGFPVVATSANRRDEPICTDGDDAVRRLTGIADCFLDHDRPIARPVEDSVVQVVCDAPQLLRYARGFAPRTVAKVDTDASILAAGGHLKSAVALVRGGEVILGGHVGDLDTLEAVEAYDRLFDDLPRLHAAAPAVVAYDRHPDYHSTRRAHAFSSGMNEASQVESSQIERVAVQHHHAHIAQTMAEHDLHGEVLGVAWDGAGYGGDGTIWGGEFLHATRADFERVGHLRPFRLPGGEAAMREPRRSALGVLWEAGGAGALERAPKVAAAFQADEARVLTSMLERDVQCVETTSAGRLFDAVASILGVCQRARFEAQAAMGLQFLAERASSSSAPELPVCVRDGVVDWRASVDALLDAQARGVAAGVAEEQLARSFHRMLARSIAQVARNVGLKTVALGGGCFQNRLLLELTVTELREAGHQVFWPQRTPPGDGGLAVGQAAVAAARRARTTFAPIP